MNLLIITSHLPYPLNMGGRQAQYHIIDFLRKNQVCISILFNENRVNSNKDLQELQKIWPDIKFYPFRWTKTKRNKEVFLLKLFRKTYCKLFSIEKPFNITNTLIFEEFTRDFILLVHSIIKKDNITVVQVEFNSFLPVVFTLPSTTKKVYIQHEIQFVKNWLLLESSQQYNDLYQQFIFNKIKHDEISAMNNYDMVITLTDIDKAKLLECGVTTVVESSPAGISGKSENNIFKGCTHKLVFVGGCIHYPNLQGLEWFFEKIWESILKTKPDTTIEIIGKWDKKYKNVFTKKYRNVKFLGFVDDLSSVLKEAIMIVPLQIGSGMRMKLIDAANYGCPFVSTSVGAEGLLFENNRDCFIEDDAIKFANKIVSLLENKNLQKRFSQNIKNIFEENYSIDILGARRFSLLNNLNNPQQ